MFWTQLRLILGRTVWRGLKWAQRRAQNILLLLLTLEGGGTE